ncbi:MAG: cytidine deaminase [Desulfuromonadales bacterium]|nr:cytidine deaminase [Desulfuromonadales bacterium]
MDISKQVFQKMVAAAKSVSKNSYSPYSNFSVGAAVLTRDGKIFSGCNVENASFGLTICAERNAIFHVLAMGHSHLDAVVVYTPTQKPTLPCGACRQVINEFGTEADVIIVCDSPEILQRKVSDLLPDAFGPNAMK